MQVGGLPTPDISWYLDGKAIRPDDYHKMLVCEKGMHSFIIEIVTVHHAGVYECMARNRAGESRFTMRLEVIGKTVTPTLDQRRQNKIFTKVCKNILRSSGSSPSSNLHPEDIKLESSGGRHCQIRV